MTQPSEPDKQKSDMTAVLERIDKLERVVNELQIEVNRFDGRLRSIGGFVGISG